MATNTVPAPEEYGRLVDRAEAYAMEHEPDLARVDRWSADVG